MKSKMKLLILIVSFFIVVGCNKANDPKRQVLNMLKGVNSYHLDADMTIYNNDDSYKYTLGVDYKDKDLFRVSMKNKANDHEQIVLRNTDGVFVLTPSLGKSFKFESDWPYNDSQSYLLQMIIKDINDDKNSMVVETDEGNVIKSKVSFSNNSKLVSQNVYLDKDNKITKVEVLDGNDKAQIVVEIIGYELNKNIDDNLFKVDNNMTVSKTYDKTYPQEINSIVYPLYVPSNTYLTSQDKVKKNDGERVILNFSGDKNFTIIEETASLSDNSVVPVSGSIYEVAGVFGVQEGNSVSWTSNGIEYYVVSEDLSGEELRSVVNSMTVLPVSK